MLVDIPVAKDAKTATSQALFEKVVEESIEFMAMRLLFMEMGEEEKAVTNRSTVKSMMCKELIDMIFACNTLLASYVPSEDERQKLYESVVEKNKARGYYD